MLCISYLLPQEHPVTDVTVKLLAEVCAAAARAGIDKRCYGNSCHVTKRATPLCGEHKRIYTHKSISGVWLVRKSLDFPENDRRLVHSLI